MARRGSLDEDVEDTLARVAETAQGLERRVLRIAFRGFLNAYALDELRAQAKGLVDELNAIETSQLNDA